jgi:hypothetical protein
MVGEILLWIVVIVTVVLVGGLVLSFFITTPIRLINYFKSNVNSYRKKRIEDGVYNYVNKYKITDREINTILEKSGISILRLSYLSVNQWGLLYQEIYKKYDPQYREDVINDVLEGD